MNRLLGLLLLVALLALATALWCARGVEPDRAAASPATRPVAAGADSRGAADASPAHRSLVPGAAPRAAPAPRAAFMGRLTRDAVPCSGVRLAARPRDFARQPRAALAEAQTDASGRFVLGPLADGAYRLELAGPDVPLGLWFAVRLAGGQDFDLGEIELPRPAILHGRVVDEAGNPLAGVRVWHRQGLELGNDAFRLDVLDPAAPEADPSVVTGADGRFRWEQQSAGRHHVRSELPGRVPRTDDVWVAAGGAADLGDLVLLPGRTLRGRVLDARGQPLAGALVAPGPGDLRRAARTGEDGSFLLRGLARGTELLVEATGHQPAKVDVPAAESLDVRLEPACTLTGRVRGAEGLPATVKLDWQSSHSLPEWMYGRSGPHPAAADGTFRIEGLAPGTYSVTAQAGSLGRSRAAMVDLPQSTPVELRVEPDLAIPVSVRNELGQPIAGAEVGVLVATDAYYDPHPDLAWRVCNAWGSVRARCDDEGQATVRGPAWERLAVFATHAEHLPAATLRAPGADGRMELTLQRGGRVTGRLRDASLRAVARLWAQIELLAPAEGDRRSLAGFDMSCDIDARGVFHSTVLPPGRYRVTLCQYDASGTFDAAPPRARRVPLLAVDEARGPSAEVEVAAGATTQVELEAPGHGALEGEVVAQGQPVPGVWVFARKVPADRHELTRDPDRVDAHGFEPHTVTDAQGRFRFLVGSAGTWELRARHPDMPAATAPVAVAVTDPRGTQRVTLSLGGAEVRGRFDHTRIPVPDQEWWGAYLFRAAEAHADPFYFPHYGSAQASGRRREPVGRTGAFRFPFVPPGRWVLRLVNRRDELVVQRILDIPETGVLDLGVLQAEATVDAELRCAAQDIHGVWVHLRDPGNPAGVFVRTVGIQNGRIPLPALPPGRYLVQGFQRFGFGPHHGIGLSGEPVGEPAAIEVGADGAVTPAVVFER